MKKIFKNPIVRIALLLLLVGGAGYGAVTFGIVDLSRFKTAVPSEPQEFMAQVNGETISTALFESRFKQIKNSNEAQGAILSDADAELLRKQILQDMINETLLLQYARKQGMGADEQAIESEYQKVAAQFPSEEEFQKYLTTQNATPEDVRSAISVRLIVQQIIDQQVTEHPFEISEQEMRQTYDQAVENGAQVPPFEEVKPDIENQLRQQKIGQLMDALIDQLRAEGTIKLFDNTNK